MQSFPVSSSILSAEHLAKFLEEKYSFPEGTQCSLIKAGINHTYLVNSSSGKYIFRIYSFNWRTKTEIEEEIGLINFLKGKKIPVSYPISDNGERIIQEIPAPEGTRFAILFSYANGEKLLNYSLETHEKVGETMALMHQHTLNHRLQRIEYCPEILLINPIPQLEKFLPIDSEEMRFMLALQRQLLDLLQNIDGENLRKGVVHLDIWFDNINVNTNQEITIFDFDFCGNGWLCIDIAYYLMQLHVIEPNEEQYKAKLQNFLKGYESVTTIPAEERKILQALGLSLYFYYLGVQCQRFENWSNVFLNETYLKRYIVMRVRKYAEFQQFDTWINPLRE